MNDWSGQRIVIHGEEVKGGTGTYYKVRVRPKAPPAEKHVVRTLGVAGKARLVKAMGELGKRWDELLLALKGSAQAVHDRISRIELEDIPEDCLPAIGKVIEAWRKGNSPSEVDQAVRGAQKPAPSPVVDEIEEEDIPF